MKLAYLFPGQGSQQLGMGKTLAEAYPVARAVFEQADQVLGEPLSALCWNGPEAELKKTVHTQPALLTHSIAALRLLEAQGIVPAYVAGHSVGEYSACVAAGAMEFADALRLVRRRGELMYRAGIERPGAMAAVLGLDDERVAEACAQVREVGVVHPANFNAPGQVVISGEPEAVEAACQAAKRLGARRAVKLEVSGAFHSPLMGPAAEGLAQALDAAPMHDARCAVIVNVSARPLRKAEELRSALKSQLLGAVRWGETLRRMLAEGVDGFIEVGTGSVLRGLLRVLDREARSWNVGDPECLAETLAAIGRVASSSTTGG